MASSCMKASLINPKNGLTLPTASQLHIPMVTIDSPAASSYVNMTNASSFTLSGTCSLNGQNVVLSGDATATVPCSNQTWSVNLNLSSLPEGLVSFTATQAGATTSMNYTKDTTPPAAFTITGITGAADSTVDSYLLDGNIATTNWNASSDANSLSYDVTIYQNDGTTVQCATQSAASPATSFSFSGCALTYKQTYKLKVVAKDAATNTTAATGGLFAFYVNHSPSATNDTIYLAKNAGATTISVLANDTDADFDALTISTVTGNGAPSATSVTTANSGSVTNNGTDVSYTPATGFTGVDAFSYAISDGHGGTSSATVTIKVMTPFTWTGAGGNSNWNQSGNWCGSLVAGVCAGGPAPGASDTAIFDGTCSSNCSATINASIDIGGLALNSGYAGTVTQGAGFSVTVETGGYSQAAGTFVGGSSAMTDNGNFTMTGGTFTSTSGTFTVSPSFSADTTIFSIGAGATFNASTGNIAFAPSIYVPCGYGKMGTIDFSGASMSLNDVTISPVRACGQVHSIAVNTGKTLVVNGNLTHSTGSLYGNLNLKGNLIVNADAVGGTGVITMNSSTGQTYSGAGGTTANLVISNSAGVTEAAGSTGLNIGSFTLTQGSFTAPVSTFKVAPFITANSTIFSIASGTTFNLPATTNVTFAPDGPSCARVNNGTIDFPGSSLNLNDVTIASIYGCSQAETVTVNTGKTLVVNGNLTHSSGTIEGNWSLKGNLIVGAGAGVQADSYTLFGGNGTITMNGSSPQTYSGAGGATANLVISNPAGVTEAVGSTGLSIGSFTLAQGSFTAPAGTFKIAPLLSANSTIFSVASGAIFNAPASDNLTFANSGQTCFNGHTGTLDFPSPLAVSHVTITPPRLCSTDESVAVAAGKILIVNGNLTHSSGHMLGNWELQGNLTVNGGVGGTANFTFMGPDSQTITLTSGTFVSGNVTLNDASVNLTLGSNLSMTSAGQALQILGGTLNMNGFNLDTTALTMSSGTIKLQGAAAAPGTLTVGGVVQSTGPYQSGNITN